MVGVNVGRAVLVADVMPSPEDLERWDLGTTTTPLGK